MIVGIDPGQKGGIVAIRNDASLYGAWLMPAAEGVGLHMSRFRSIFMDLAVISPGPLHVFLEKVQPFPGDGVQGLFKYSRDYGRVQGILHCCGVSCSLVPPRTWQKPILGTIAHKGPALPRPGSGVSAPELRRLKRVRKLARRKLIKARGVQVVQERIPALDLTPGRLRVPHDGLSDAACIALYGWEKIGGVSQ